MMMLKKRAVLLIGLMACLVSCSVPAQPTNVVGAPAIAGATPDGQPTPGISALHEKIGKLGDAAPPLTVLEWIKGEPRKIKSGTNLLVLVFCSLSRANEFALTNLSRLQEKYQDKGVVTVAISDDPPDQLRTFVQLKEADIDFSVAADEIPSRTARNFLHAFRQIQLPRAFIVDTNGNVLWFGHPLTDGMGEAVEEITSGRYDLQQSQKDIVAREQMEQYLALARQADGRSAIVGRKLLAIRTNDAPGLCSLASKIATDPYIQDRDFDLAKAALDRAEQLSSTNATDIAVDRAILLFQAGRETDGLATARRALASAQSPDDKEEAQICIHAMETRLAAKASQTTTNNITDPANGH